MRTDLLLKALCLLLLSTLSFSLLANEKCHGTGEKIVSIGGANTEVLFALGLGDCIIAIDTSSTYPETTHSLPKVGYMRTLSAEPIIAMQPSLIVLDQGSGPPEAIEAIQRFGIPVLNSPKITSFELLLNHIDQLGAELSVSEQAELLSLAIQKDVDTLRARLARNGEAGDGASPPTVAFMMSVNSHEVLLAGRQTAADSMIALSGGQNVVDSFYGYKPVNGEAIAKLNPEIIISTYRAVETSTAKIDAKSAGASADASEELALLPSIKHSNAARNRQIFLFDTHYLLGFGPRSAQAAIELSQLLVP